ncbi:phenylacetate--CoA ligase family protein [Haloferula chungangensis]|uniref:Phenylacetate--CoA ligase family protein n=1 Tax=Haloferula chungangensis TaxID=1048331 RepID=A0ABW2L1M3_9BACT
MSHQAKNWWESSSRDELHHRQGELLRHFLKNRVVPFAAYYRKLFADHDLSADDIQSTDDLTKLPFTSKRHFENPKDFVIIPDEDVLKHQWSTIKRAITRGPTRAKIELEEELRPILLTSTTGRSSAPVPFLYTKHDLHQLEVGGRRMMELCQSDPAWRHINAFPFAPHLAFWQAHYASLGYNAFMVASGGGKTMGTEGNIRLIDKIDPDAIIAMPTFLYHLLQEGAAAGSRWKNLKRLVLGGEKVPAGMRRKLRDLCTEMGAPQVAIMSTYGFTEAKVAWTECMAPAGAEPSGFHTYPDMGFVEIIDPESGERVPDHHPGEIVITHLDSRGTIVLRYRTGDLIDGGLSHEPCPYCGRRCPRLIGKISRVSDIQRLNIGKLKGTLVDFNRLENLLDDTDNLGAWQMEIRKRNDDPLESDILIVHAVAMTDDQEQLRDAVNERFRSVTEFSPNEIVFHSWDKMRKMQGVGKELKEKKVVDHRPKET